MEKAASIDTMLGGRRRERLERLQELAKEIWRDKAGFAGIVLIFMLLFMAFAAPLLAPHDPAAQDLRARLSPPAWLEKG
ncbi:MAG: ABC transporter permease, partial [bacterium]|nr:ABC transporter permease [bacterium]